MISHIDHVTVVVRDVAKAKAFFSLLGFAEEKSVIISGPTFARYMGVEGIEAEHVTLVSKESKSALSDSTAAIHPTGTPRRGQCGEPGEAGL